MEDLVSIIMPAYNVDEYIEESIRSIQAQTYPNWELIVVNDGSTDTTQAVVERLASQDSRIRLVTQPNGGVSRARNRGLELARGEYISFLDGDDLWEPTFLRELIDAKKRPMLEWPIADMTISMPANFAGSTDINSGVDGYLQMRSMEPYVCISEQYWWIGLL